jgi:hypothetical protein
MSINMLSGLVFVVAGLSTILRRRRIASEAARRNWFWLGRTSDVEADAVRYGVVGCVLAAGGLAVLIFRPFS